MPFSSDDDDAPYQTEAQRRRKFLEQKKQSARKKNFGTKLTFKDEDDTIGVKKMASYGSSGDKGMVSQAYVAKAGIFDGRPDVVCHTCNTAMPPIAKFCMECGATLPHQKANNPNLTHSERNLLERGMSGTFDPNAIMAEDDDDVPTIATDEQPGFSSPHKNYHGNNYGGSPGKDLLSPSTKFNDRQPLNQSPNSSAPPKHFSSDTNMSLQRSKRSDSNSNDPAGKTIMPPPLEIDMNTLDSLVEGPVPAGGTVRCFIKRIRSGIKGKMFPTYELYLERPRRRVMVAKKRSGNKLQNYKIALDNRALDNDSDPFLAKVRAQDAHNFIIWDGGVKELQARGGMSDNKRSDIVGVQYELIYLAPKKMWIVVPDPEVDYALDTEKDSMLRRMKDRETDGLILLRNKSAVFDKKRNQNILDFHGRVTKTSQKNFILTLADQSSAENNETDVLLFGRIGKDMFNMDVAYPLSLTQALGISLTSLDNNLLG